MLEIVITGRHDNYGGADFLDRLCAAAEHNRRLLSDAGVAHAFTLVEWNPVAENPLLAELVRARLPWWDNCLVVDREWHRRLSTNPRLQFMEFFAKNAAIRRSGADAILTTNSDVFLSSEVANALSRRRLDDRTVYRAVRIDIDRHAPWHGGETVFATPRHQLRVNDLQPPDYGNSAGDFLLLTRTAWLTLGGFNERIRYAKIHKDGQFCFNAARDGFRFETLGPVYHIDHEGSYANAGAMRGSPDMHYGPEWDYRHPYRNPASWGLAPAVDTAEGGGITHVHHPSTHGPLLSVVDPGSNAERSVAAAVNDGLARSRGKFVVVTSDPDLSAFGGRSALIETLSATAAGLIVPAGALVRHATLGPVPALGAPFVIRRDVIDALTEWDESEPDAAMAFWLHAIEHTSPVEMAQPGPVRFALAPAIRAGLEATVLRRRGAPICTAPEAAVVREHLAAARDLRGVVRQWMEAHVPAGERCAIVGPDWATPFLIEAVQASGRACAGLYTSLAAEEGTSRWGERLRPLAALTNAGISHVLTGSSGPLAERLAAFGCAAAIHVLAGTAEHDAGADAELDMLRRAQARDVAANRADEVLARLPLLSALEGQLRWNHSYDAAQVCERVGRVDAAARLYREVMDGCQADAALRMRATFHVGRLLVEAGRIDLAEPLLASVLRHNPAHRAARQLLDSCRAAAAGEGGRTVVR